MYPTKAATGCVQLKVAYPVANGKIVPSATTVLRRPKPPEAASVNVGEEIRPDTPPRSVKVQVAACELTFVAARLERYAVLPAKPSAICGKT